MWRKVRKWLGMGAYPLAYRAAVLWRSLDLLVDDQILAEKVPQRYRGVASPLSDEGRKAVMEEIRALLPQILKIWLPRFIKRPRSRKMFSAAFRRQVAAGASSLFVDREAEYERADAGSVIYKAIYNVRRAVEIDTPSPMISRDLAEFVVLTVREEFLEAMKLVFDDRLPDLSYFDRQKRLYAARKVRRDDVIHAAGDSVDTPSSHS